jgi:hypothetical protein
MERLSTVLLGLTLSVLSTVALPQALTPDTFVQADIEARAVTVEGLQAQLTALQQGADYATQWQLAEDNRRAVTAVFHKFGVTGATHAAYGTYHRDAIEQWLAAHPDWEQQYTDLAARLAFLAGQIDTLRGGR